MSQVSAAVLRRRSRHAYSMTLAATNNMIVPSFTAGNVEP